MKDMVQRQYDNVLQTVYNLMHTELLVPATEVDEMEICCELVELYERFFAPQMEVEF
jgi:hypothetical protein